MHRSSGRGHCGHFKMILRFSPRTTGSPYSSQTEFCESSMRRGAAHSGRMVGKPHLTEVRKSRQRQPAGNSPRKRMNRGMQYCFPPW